MSADEAARSARLAPVYARAVLSARRKGTAVRAAAAAGEPLVLPSGADGRPAVVVHPGVAVGAGRAAALARATGVPLRPVLPVVGPHLLAFAAQLELLSAEDFPLPLPGLVHVTQVVRASRPLGVGERVDVKVVARGPLPHAKGAVVELMSTLTSGGDAGEVVWEGVSGYLARGATVPEGQAAHDLSLPEPATRAAARWRVPADAGRRYATVSGDVNPIHLSRLAARAFGFRGAIAHGMWTLARAVGQVEPQLAAATAGPGGVEVRARWGSPLLLGSRAVLCVEPYDAEGAEGGWSLAVRSGTPLPGERVHLTATASPLHS
ncbi:Acyl dehydratase [Quadrisphaera granulorum]|uniref:Acyl dehydratase n=1 Tax=Quadrisphaera granulorum TaxID=317664 RepID=A0A316AA42_9ACTN|nr:MaoC/PaaZ C-terminal domain-containing protein [Quadrisphaera granulorum]PWJ54645.1 acyl dehydratase [Quadrisphaera granulorum]SZE96007.1 Acyl dehydratase [Quadrisphaera granulorum]